MPDFIPFGTRLRETLKVISTLDKAKLPIRSMVFAPEAVQILLARAPTASQLSGDEIKVIGGPTGLHRVMHHQIGFVEIVWTLPYVHHQPVLSGRLH